MLVYAHGPKLNNETGMALHACLYFRGKKENSTKKKIDIVENSMPLDHIKHFLS